MQIKMKTLLAGPGGIRHVGQVYEVSKKEGKALIEAGAAEEAEVNEAAAANETVQAPKPQKAEPETATISPSEDATPFPRPVSGRRGWFQLSDDRHVRGKTNAEAEQKKLKAEG